MAHGSTEHSNNQTRPIRGGGITPSLIVDGHRYQVDELLGKESAAIVRIDEKKVRLEVLHQAVPGPSSLLLRSGSRVFRISVEPSEDHESYFVEINGTPLTVTLATDSTPSMDDKIRGAAGPILIKSPMAGKIAAVKTSAGEMVEEGQALVMLEAMKMENEIASPRSGRVKEVYVQAGALAKPGDKLVLIE